MPEKTYAMIVNGVIRNVCLWDGETPFAPTVTIDGVETPVELTALDELPPGAGNGWLVEDGEWRAPDLPERKKP